MGPEKSLPLPKGYNDEEAYMTDLLSFVASSELLELFCGGVHILDFFTRSPDLYTRVIDADWREWFDLHELEDVLDFVLREDVECIASRDHIASWRGLKGPPRSFVNFVASVRKLLLCREYESIDDEAMPRSVSVGMNTKKTHEVGNFSKFIERLTEDTEALRGKPITHLVDFGAGQNYLGRVLASPRYGRHIVAVEGRTNNVAGARRMDVAAKVAPKNGVMRNKKQYRAEREESRGSKQMHADHGDAIEIPSDGALPQIPHTVSSPAFKAPEGSGSVLHVGKQLDNGDLSDVVAELRANYEGVNEDVDEQNQETNFLVMSLHSCGTLSHHGLRSLVVNPLVSAVAIVGCCYNLMTERFKPTATNPRLPNLRPPRQPKAGEAADGTHVHGFPMSSRILEYPTRYGQGIYLNITARMMAVQAPQNWGPADSEAFFTRHFFRALLQKVFLDKGVVELPAVDGRANGRGYDIVGGSSANGDGQEGTKPIIIGSLRKSCYRDFTSYVRGAIQKLERDKDENEASLIQDRMGRITDDEIESYAQQYAPRRKHLSIVWTLMAYTAGLIEAIIVLDRWLWLREQKEVDACWVQSVFDYKTSPRNLVVVGVKR